MDATTTIEYGFLDTNGAYVCAFCVEVPTYTMAQNSFADWRAIDTAVFESAGILNNGGLNNE